MADSGPEQWPLAIIRNASRLDVGIEIFFELVMAGHLGELCEAGATSATVRMSKFATPTRPSASRPLPVWPENRHNPFQTNDLSTTEAADEETQIVGPRNLQPKFPLFSATYPKPEPASAQPNVILQS
jgi:hypothetical protein